MERQIAGFEFERFAAEVYGIELSSNYADKFDGTLNGIPVSIKFEKYGTDVGMADYFRNANIETDFYLLVGFHKNLKIEKVHWLYIPANDYRILFSNNCSVFFSKMLKEITNNYQDDEKWYSLIQEAKTMWKENTPNLIRPRFKRDHKTQKRIQCAINNKDFYNYFLPKYEVKIQ